MYCAVLILFSMTWLLFTPRSSPTHFTQPLRHVGDIGTILNAVTHAHWHTHTRHISRTFDTLYVWTLPPHLPHIKHTSSFPSPHSHPHPPHTPHSHPHPPHTPHSHTTLTHTPSPHSHTPTLICSQVQCGRGHSNPPVRLLLSNPVQPSPTHPSHISPLTACRFTPSHRRQ